MLVRPKFQTLPIALPPVVFEIQGVPNALNNLKWPWGRSFPSTLLFTLKTDSQGQNVSLFPSTTRHVLWFKIAYGPPGPTDGWHTTTNERRAVALLPEGNDRSPKFYRRLSVYVESRHTSTHLSSQYRTNIFLQSGFSDFVMQWIYDKRILLSTYILDNVYVITVCERWNGLLCDSQHV